MRVLILGAGAAGLAAAIALRKLGYHTTLVEQGKIGANLGGGIDIQPNGTRALYALGCEVKEAIQELTRFNGRDISISCNQGKTLNRIPLDQYEADPCYPLLSFLRKDLLDILFEIACPNEVFEQKKCLEACWNDDEVSLTLDNGVKLTGDLLIAADGINSIIRQTLFPHIQKQYLGHISLGGVVSTEHFRHNYIHGLNRTCVVFPCTQSHCHTVMFLPKPQGWLRSYAPSFVEQRDLFRGWSHEVDHILDHLEDTNRFCLEAHEVPPLPFFAQKRVFLVGDAAHAMSPLGALATSLALEDVYDLTQILSKGMSIEEQALTYSHRRKQRAEEIRNYSLSVLVAGIVSHGPQDFAARVERFSSLPSDQVLKPQRNLLQRDLEEQCVHASSL